MPRKQTKTYNERMYLSNTQALLHMPRFRWIQDRLRRLQCQPTSVLELGCADGKIIDFLPSRPARYVGLDNNDNQLALARKKWNDSERVEFIKCNTADDITLNERFDIFICMETFEHIPSEILETYLSKVAQLTKKYAFITVPNEKGVMFALKHLARVAIGWNFYRLTLAEIVYSTLGQTQKVEHWHHKGFDYTRFLATLKNYFRVIDVVASPIEQVPTMFGYSIAIVGERTDELAL
jgi:cyclopropane fatty-acyl-phospholipid synthase-like methyltransferase